MAKFNEVEELKTLNVLAYVSLSREWFWVTASVHNAPTLDEAYALRDWLNSALPADRASKP